MVERKYGNLDLSERETQKPQTVKSSVDQLITSRFDKLTRSAKLPRALGFLSGLSFLLGTRGIHPEPAYAQSSKPDCQFVFGFKTLHDQLPQVGNCLEDQKYTLNRNATQRTSGGVLVWRAFDNWTAFIENSKDNPKAYIIDPQGIIEDRQLSQLRFLWENNPNFEPILIPPPLINLSHVADEKYKKFLEILQGMVWQVAPHTLNLHDIDSDYETYLKTSYPGVDLEKLKSNLGTLDDAVRDVNYISTDKSDLARVPKKSTSFAWQPNGNYIIYNRDAVYNHDSVSTELGLDGRLGLFKEIWAIRIYKLLLLQGVSQNIAAHFAENFSNYLAGLFNDFLYEEGYIHTTYDNILKKSATMYNCC